MAGSPLEQVVRHLRHAAGAPGDELGDRELLDRFIQYKDETAFARPPLPEELHHTLRFLEDQGRRHGKSADAPEAWADLCHVLLSCNEFAYVD